MFSFSDLRSMMGQIPKQLTYPLLILTALVSPLLVLLDKDNIFNNYNTKPYVIDFENPPLLDTFETKHITFLNACLSSEVVTVTKDSKTQEFIPIIPCDSLPHHKVKFFLNVNQSHVKNIDSVWGSINNGIFEGKLKKGSTELDKAKNLFSRAGVSFDSNCYEIIAGYDPSEDFGKYAMDIAFLFVIPLSAIATCFLVRRDHKKKEEKEEEENSTYIKPKPGNKSTSIDHF
jgi:hypothetical protein